MKKVTLWTNFGSRSVFHTNAPMDDIIRIYEDEWGMIRIRDETGNVVYETNGLNDFLKEKK